VSISGKNGKGGQESKTIRKWSSTSNATRTLEGQFVKTGSGRAEREAVSAEEG